MDRLGNKHGAAELEAMIDAEFAERDDNTEKSEKTEKTKQTENAVLVNIPGTPNNPTLIEVDQRDLAARHSLEADTQARIILVDAFNVLHAVLLGRERDHGWWRREERERLLRRITGWTNGPDEIWVAFDGAQPAWSVWAEPVLRPITVAARGPIVHSVYVESADDWIVRRARRSAHPEQMIVVSADRKVAGRARSAGCEIWTPWAFISQCPTHSDRPGESEESEESGTTA